MLLEEGWGEGRFVPVNVMSSEKAYEQNWQVAVINHLDLEMG